MALGSHWNSSRRGRPVIAGSDAELLEANIRMQRIGQRSRLVVSCIGHDHIHVAALCGPGEVGRMVQSVESSITQVNGLDPGFAPFYEKAIEDQRHLEMVARYILRHSKKEARPHDPDHLGNNGPELIGGRLLRLRRGGLIIPPSREVAARFLPKITDEEIEKMLVGGRKRIELDTFGSAPAGLAGVELEEVLMGAAAAAIGLLDLDRRRAGVADARAALLQLVETSPFIGSIRPVRMLGLDLSTLRRLRTREVWGPLAYAVRWQVEFRLTRRALAPMAR